MKPLKTVDTVLSDTIMVHYPILQDHYIELKTALEAYVDKLVIEARLDELTKLPGRAIESGGAAYQYWGYVHDEREDRIAELRLSHKERED